MPGSTSRTDEMEIVNPNTGMSRYKLNADGLRLGEEGQPVTQILGLDLSLNHTGWCFCECAAPGAMNFGVHNLEKSPLDEIGKMHFLVEWLKPMLRPGLLVMIEGFAFHAQGKAVLQLAGLQYLVRHQLFQSGTPFRLIAPSQAKKFLTGKHNADKNVILKEVFKRYRIDVDDDNIADAINMSRIGQALIGLIALENQAQREVVEELAAGKARTKPKRTSKASSLHANRPLEGGRLVQQSAMEPQS